MKTRSLSLVTVVMIAAIIAGSFLYYLSFERTETTLQEPYATLTISRLDNFIPVTMDVPFHAVDAIMSSSQGCDGCLILKETILDVNYIYNKTADKCDQNGKLENGYCDNIPVYAVYHANLTQNQYYQVTSAEPLKFLNSTKYWSSILFYKNPQCFPFANHLTVYPKKDGFCYYSLTLVKNGYTEE